MFLASLKSACFGLNLTAANKVVLLDAWWNPTVEDQAVDRVYRLGQKRDVQVIRLVINGSIEERVIESQEKKRGLAASAFGESSKGKTKKMKESRLADLKVYPNLYFIVRICTTMLDETLLDQRLMIS